MKASEKRILDCVRAAGPAGATLDELAECLPWTKAYVWHLVERLVEQGWLVASARTRGGQRALHAVDDAVREGPRCRVCGCSDYDCGTCVERTGFPCYWAGDGLCSACVGVESEVPT